MIRLGAFALCLLLSAMTTARALDIPIVYLTRTEDPRLPLALIDRVVEDPGVWGARLALQDNATTGGFLGQDYTLIEVTVPADGDVLATFAAEVDKGHRLFVSDLPRADLLAIARAPESAETLIFNGRVGDDDLRTDLCFPQVFHTALSRAMRADGLVQFLVWKRWTRLFLLSGTREGDIAFAEAVRHAAKKFGAEVVAEKTYDYSPISRRTDSGHIQVQQQMPVATEGGGDYQVLIAADESEVFGEYLPYNTREPRPVAGTHGLVATSWHRVQEQWGSTQFQRRFEELAGRWMEERDYGAWLGVRAIGEAVTRVSTAEPADLRAYLRGGDFALGGFKGVGLSFRPWSQQMRQPVLLVNKRVLVSASPQPGFLHQRTPLDGLGFDEPETRCALN